jgi:DnaJ-domain-containing protein 1
VRPPFELDLASQTPIRSGPWNKTDSEWCGAETGAPLLTQIERVLGEEVEPDAAFFVDSWSLGVAAASENLARRQQEQKQRQSRALGGVPLSSFVPFFMTEPVPVVPERPRSMNSDDARAWEEEEIEPVVTSPLTFEAACGLLGVNVSSTRDQIKTAYRKMASRYHPDRFACAGTRERQIAGDRMAAINEAYRFLCAARIDPIV